MFKVPPSLCTGILYKAKCLTQHALSCVFLIKLHANRSSLSNARGMRGVSYQINSHKWEKSETEIYLMTMDRILMQKLISFLQQKLCSFGYTSMYELLHFLNFRHGLMVHINAYFACFMNRHIIFEDLYLCCIFSFWNIYHYIYF
jgi:hypothetical protein